ncbi:MAG: HNH endonuclease [Planctomycetes bacterium]|nr:HNH endonuclease [Planctomycetota bacterium]
MRTRGWVIGGDPKSARADGCVVQPLVPLVVLPEIQEELGGTRQEPHGAFEEGKVTVGHGGHYARARQASLPRKTPEPFLRRTYARAEGCRTVVLGFGSVAPVLGWRAREGAMSEDKAGRRRGRTTSVHGERILELTAYRNSIDHAILTELRAFDRGGEWRRDGATSCAVWLSWYAGMKLKTAHEHVRVARALAELPLVEDAMRRGVLSYTQARAVTRVATAETQGSLLELALTSSGEELERAVRFIRQRAAADAGRIDPGELRLWFDQLDDGSEVMHARLRPEQAATLRKALDGAKELQCPENPTSVSDVDALMLLVDRATRPVGDEKEATIARRFEVLLTVDAESLAAPQRPAEARCELGDGTQVSRATARRIVCDAPVQALLVGQDGTPLDVGRRTSRISAALRRALIARDRHCTFPGCTSRRGLDAHHIEHWIDGGETKEENLTLLCRRHHVIVHEDGYTIHRTARGLEFRNRGGVPLPRGPSVPEVPPVPVAIQATTALLQAALEAATREALARARGA